MQEDNAKDLYLKYSNIRSNISGTLCQYCWDERKDNITNSESFKFKLKFAGNANNADSKAVEITLSLTCLNSCCITLEIPEICCEINLILNWSLQIMLLLIQQMQQHLTKIMIQNTKNYIPVVTSAVHDDTQRFKRTFQKWWWQN